MTRRGWMLFGLLGVIWGIPYLLIRIAVRDIDPPTLVLFRAAGASVLLVPVVIHQGGFAAVLRRWRAVIAFTIAEVAIPWLFLFRAEQRLTSSLSGMLLALVPTLAVVVAVVARSDDRLTRRRALGLVVGLSGVVVLVGVDVHGTSLIGVGECVVTALGYATGPLIVSRYLRGVSSTAVIAAALSLTAIAYAPIGLTRLPHVMTAEVIWSVVLLTVICTVAGFLVFFLLIEEVGPARSTVITYVNPAVAIALGIVVLSEPFTLGIALGFPIVLVGSYLATGGLRSREPDEESPAEAVGAEVT